MSNVQAVSDRDILWLADAPRCTTEERRVYERYLVRHRRHRWAGGLFGVAFAVVVGIRYYSSITIGIGHGSPLADVLFCGVAGVQIGSLSAETFRLATPPSLHTAASLAPRGDYRPARLTFLARLLTLAAVAIGAIGVATGNGLGALAIASGGIAFAVVAEATQAAISGRRRPVLSDAAQYVDARLRTFAAGVMAQLQLAAAVLALGWTLSKVARPGSELFGVGRLLGLTACVGAATILLRRAAPRPPRRWVAPT